MSLGLNESLIGPAQLVGSVLNRLPIKSNIHPKSEGSSKVVALQSWLEMKCLELVTSFGNETFQALTLHVSQPQPRVSIQLKPRTLMKTSLMPMEMLSRHRPKTCEHTQVASRRLEMKVSMTIAFPPPSRGRRLALAKSRSITTRTCQHLHPHFKETAIDKTSATVAYSRRLLRHQARKTLTISHALQPPIGLFHALLA